VNLIDAHPNAIFVRNEELYGKFYKWADDPKRIYKHLYDSAKRYQNRPFSANGYKYNIPGVGFAENPIVIGHKSSTRRYLPVANSWEKLTEFHKAVALPLKFLHLIRSPYDQINARWQQKEFRRKKAPLGEIIKHVREQTEGNYQMWCKTGEEEYLQVHYEDIQEFPVSIMTTICYFLNLPLNSKHLADCKNLVYTHKEKEAITWTDEDKAAVVDLCKDYPEFYERYDAR